MGTDIHTFIFKKEDNTYKELQLFKNNGQPIGYMAPYNNRNYELFGKLAGVRSMEADFTVIRGLPEWTPQYVCDKYEEYGHSATWYDWVELEAYSKLEKTCGEDALHYWLQSLYFVLDSYGVWYPDPGEITIVIFFDN